MAKQHAKFNEAAMPLPHAIKEFINIGARAMAAKEKPAAVSGVGLGALVNLFNNTNVMETALPLLSHNRIDVPARFVGHAQRNTVSVDVECGQATLQLGNVGIEPTSLGTR